MGFHFVISQAQHWVKERIGAGDIAVDATAGNGSDTLFLAGLLGAKGTVYVFDIQAEALAQTQTRLQATASKPDQLANVNLLLAGHEHMASHIAAEHHGQIAAIMFNLGFLPGAASTIITQTSTTLAALEAALLLLRSGGILTVVVYPGHEGGQAEAAAVESWASNVPPSLAQAIVYRFPQKAAAPYLIGLIKK
ncbi:class I SAM-dependent methyltransferase [Cohnella abietis]|uniref:SAM-dependent methyltransferase n=1 Tax=Cohnella abietis TaxID=2507935 RepID=A0A3T1D216_9BACL|nr:class I SAM-dependent methyltransferase [Cohnella abietis]BBI32124.1 SAM-dependent methyltransferase [Cohnella abietis]